MATTRINAVSATATTFAGDDFLPIDGNVNATRRILVTSLFASASAIGSVTPAAGTFTSLSGTNINGTLGATTPSSVAATTGTFSSTLSVTGVATLGNGAILGTPASGTVTNLTGTASININGTVGATTPSSVAATTISASGQITSTIDGAKYLSRTGTSITQQFQEVGNTGGNYQLGVERSTGGALVVGGTAYATVLTTTGATNIEFGVNVQKVATLTSTGLNSTAIGATTPSTIAATTGTFTGAVTVDPSSGISIDAINNAATYALRIRRTNTINRNWGMYVDSGGLLKFDDITGATNPLSLSATGAAITGTLSATGITNFGGGTAYSNGMTIKPASNDYTLTLLQSNVNNAGWGMYADTGGGFSLARYGGGVFSTACFTAALGGAISMTNGLAITGTVTTTKDNGGVTLNNSTTGNAEIYFQAGGTNKVRIGLVGGSTPTGLRIYSDMGGAEYATFSATGLAVTGTLSATGKATFNGAVTTEALNVSTASGGAWMAVRDTVSQAAGKTTLIGCAGDGSAAIYQTGNYPVEFYVNEVKKGSFSSTGLAVTGALSASSSLTVAGSGTIDSNIYSKSDGTTYGSWIGSGYVMAAQVGGAIALLNRNGSDGGIVNFYRSGTTVGTISVTTTATAYNTSSDYRLKNVDGPVVDSGTFIDALKPKVGTWKSDGSKFVGFIAHEFAEVSPSSVVGEKDAVDADGKAVYQSMQASSSEVIANLVAELQSLRKRLAALESK